MTAEYPRTVAPPPPRFGARRLYRDAGSMAFSSVASAVLGLGFWSVAATMFTAAELGVMTAVLSVIVAAGLVLASGLGDAYTSILPAAGHARGDVYRRGQRFLAVLALTTGVCGGCLVVTVLPEVHGSVPVAAIVAVGIFAWSAFLLQNSTLIALGRASWLPAVNIGVSTGKMSLLLIIGLTVQWHSVELAFIASALSVVVILRSRIRRIIADNDGLPDATTVSPHLAVGVFNQLASRTMASAILTLGVLTLSPFLVTVFAGAREGALFALSLSVVQMLDLIPASMTVSFVVHACAAPAGAQKMLQGIMIRASCLTAVGAVLLVAGFPLVLRLLNAEYGEMNALGVIAVLSLTSVLRVVYTVWSGHQRARREMSALLTINVIAAAVLIAVLPAACSSHGAFGGGLAVFLSQALLSFGALTHYLISRRRGGARP